MKMDTETISDHVEDNGSLRISAVKDSSDEPTVERSDHGEREGVRSEETTSNGDDCSIAIKGSVIGGGSRSSENSKAEKVCRICHFGSELELIPIGCDCRGELGSSHLHCAEAWFRQKGDRVCEICGKMAKNISDNSEETSAILMMEWNEMRMVAAILDTSRDQNSRRCKQYLCKLLLACLVLAFLLPWFFRGIIDIF